MTGQPSRTIAVITTGRQDWGILRSVARAIRGQPGLALALVAGGMHLSPRHGRSVDLVTADGFELAAALPWLPDDVSAQQPAAADQAALALARIGAWLGATTPDAIVVAGERFETLAAALAATLALVPLVHLHGGEQTLGAFDDRLRHAITKLADLHLVSHEEHRRRVIAVGEDPAMVHVVGAPALDNLARADLPGADELAAKLGVELKRPIVAVTVQPVTLDDDPVAAARAVAAAMDAVPATYLVTLPNVDPGGSDVEATMRAASSAPGRVAVEALGERDYWGLLRLADAMLGNSSSGIVEAPAVRLPVVNVGDRQAGRRREANVIDVPVDVDAIAAGLRRALDPGFRASLPALDPQLLDGRAGERAARIIAAWQPPRPPRKAPIDVGP